MGWIRIIGRDLKDRDRLERAATRAGLDLTPTDAPPAVIVVDLDREGVPKDLPEGIRTVGYYSHVNEELARRADAAGIEAIPRGKFWTELPDLLTRG